MGSWASKFREMASWAVISMAWVISVDDCEDLSFVRAALRRGYVEGEEGEVREVPAWDGKGEDRWGEEEDVAVPRV
jgi:hypothetical protein